MTPTRAASASDFLAGNRGNAACTLRSTVCPTVNSCGLQRCARLLGSAAGPRNMYTGDQYQLQKQSTQRAEWAASVRTSTSSRKHQFWEPHLDPPPLLADVVLVVVSPRRAVSLGTVARAASCFEVGSIRVVAPRCDYMTRHSKSASKGAQYMMWQAQEFDTVAEAIRDCDLSVAFTRWVAGRPNAFFDLSALMSHPVMQELIRDAVPASSSKGDQQASPQPPSSLEDDKTPRQDQHASGSASAEDAAQQPACSSGSGGQPVEGHAQLPDQQGVQRRRTRVALVFGREELGLSDDEVDACSAACSIPIGRLQESLSLSHAVSIALSGMYAQRLAFVSGTSAGPAALLPCAISPAAKVGSLAPSPYLVTSVHQLAEGYASEGKEL